MDIEQNDDTMKEILMDDQKAVKKAGKRKGCLVRFLILMIFLFTVLLGFILIQQYLLDLEAEAIVRAARTATAMEKAVIDAQLEEAIPATQEAVEFTRTPSPAPTEDSLMMRTATVAAQLTDVAAFQSAITPEP